MGIRDYIILIMCFQIGLFLNSGLIGTFTTHNSKRTNNKDFYFPAISFLFFLSL